MKQPFEAEGIIWEGWIQWMLSEIATWQHLYPDNPEQQQEHIRHDLEHLVSTVAKRHNQEGGY